MTRVLILLATLLVVAACASPTPTVDRQRAANYGPPPPANAEDIIRAEFDTKLKDGATARYQLYEPAKSFLKTSPLMGTTERFGWRICGRVNAKNSFGAYTGWKPFLTFWDHGNIVFSMLPDGDLQRAMSSQVCNRFADAG